MSVNEADDSPVSSSFFLHVVTMRPRRSSRRLEVDAHVANDRRTDSALTQQAEQPMPGADMAVANPLGLLAGQGTRPLGRRGQRDRKVEGKVGLVAELIK
jgi:hypothetical protein